MAVREHGKTVHLDDRPNWPVARLCSGRFIMTSHRQGRILDDGRLRRRSCAMHRNTALIAGIAAILLLAAGCGNSGGHGTAPGGGADAESGTGGGTASGGH